MKRVAVLIVCCITLFAFQNKVMNVRKGEVFKIILKANHSTGYSWQWENKSKNSILDSVYMQYTLSDKAITGSGGNEIWEFKANKKGQEKLIMVYKRPWEEGKGIERREIYIKVE